MKSTKRISLLLGILMVLTVIFSAGAVFAESPEITSYYSNEKSGSYITIISGAEATQEKYNTTRTASGYNTVTNDHYKSVIRGSIFLGYTNNNFGTKNITLKANKEFGFTLNGTTVRPGEAKEFNLDLTKEHTITLNIPTNQEEYGNYGEGSYVLRAGNINDIVTVTARVSVDNARKWVAGNYPGIVQPHEIPAEKADVSNALEGFNKIPEGPIEFKVEKGTTAMEVLGKYGSLYNMDIVGMDSNYVRSMGVGNFNKLGERSIINTSGWLYYIKDDGEWDLPGMGASAYEFTKDSEMEWHLTLKWGDITPGWPVQRSVVINHRTFDELDNQSLTIGDLIPQWKDAPRASELLVTSK